jgi:multiple sugar transport system substrate-binding protein
MKKQFLLIVSVLLIATQILSACAQPTPAATQPPAAPTQPPAAEPTQPPAEPTQPAVEPTQPPAAPTQAPATKAPAAVTVDWKAYSGTTLHLLMNKHVYTDTIAKYIEEFTALTGIKVVIDEYSQDDFMNKRLVDFSSGSGAYDFTMMDQATPQYARSGWIEDLGPYFNNPKLVDQTAYDMKDVANLFLSQFTVDGKIYAIPVSGEAQIVYYRKDIFAEKGLNPPKTFDDLVALAKALKTPDMPGICVRGQKIHTVSNSTGVIWSYGGRIMNDPENPTQAVFNSPEAIKAVELYAGLARDYGPKGEGNYTWQECVSDFQQGKVPMYLDVSVFMSQLEDPKLSTVSGKIGYAPMPSGPAGSFPNGGSWAVGINSASKNKEAAFLFLAWVTGKEMQLKIATDAAITSRQSVLDDPALAQKFPADWLAAFKTDMASTLPEHNFPPVTKIDEFMDIYGGAVNAVIIGTSDAKTALDDAAKKVDALLASK